jgi:O-acetyl-ADP-ribose deacetylase (regulator of RNase III)
MDRNLISVIQGDITKLDCDAIVNAANHSLLGGGGVDGAIHRAAGPKLLEECSALAGCATGEAKLTRGYNLPAKYVIHTVGPIYGREKGKEAALLAACYLNSLNLARENNLKTIAFPAISTGAYGYPKVAAANIAFKSIRYFLENNQAYRFSKIILAAYSEDDFKIYQALWRKMAQAW